MDLHSLLGSAQRMPTIPRVTQQLIASLSDDGVSLRQIAGLIASDPVLSAKLLRLANSAYFQQSRSIATVDDALRFLGLSMVRNLVLGNSLVGAFGQIQGVDLPQFWRHSLLTACAARWLAQRLDLDGELVFTVGLLHGIGSLQMHAAHPAALAPLDRRLGVHEAGRAALERLMLGFHFGDVSAALAQHWNFPAAMVAALRAAPDPLHEPPLHPAAALVYLGAWCSRREAQATAAEVAPPEGLPQLLQGLQLDDTWIATAQAPQSGHTMPPLSSLTRGLEALLESG